MQLCRALRMQRETDSRRLPSRERRPLVGRPCLIAPQSSHDLAKIAWRRELGLSDARRAQCCPQIFWCPDRCCGRRPKHDLLRLPAGPRRGSRYLRDRLGSCARLACVQKAGSANRQSPLKPRRYLEPPPNHDTHRMDEVSAPLTGLSKKRRGRAVSIIVPSRRFRMPKRKCMAGLQKSD